MNNSDNQYPQMTYKQAVEYCKYWADQIRHKGLDLLTTDYGAVIGISDRLAYALYMQTWIDPQKYYHLYQVRIYAINIEYNYTDRASWEKLLELIDDLPEEYGKNNQYPQMTYKQAVEYCKYWADQIRHKGLDLLTTDYGEVMRVSDQLAYALYMQTWIDPQKYYPLYRVRTYAINIDYNNYTNRALWEKLLELIDDLPEEYGKNNQYPQMTYKQAVKHCTHWADQIRADGLDLLTTDYVAAIGVSDQLAYALYMQTWIDPQKYYPLYRVRTYAINIDYNNYTNRALWEKLLELIDDLPEEYGKNNQYPQMTYKQAVKHCTHWADQIRADGLDLLTTDYGAAIGVSDKLAYPLDMQEWISAPRYPDIYAIRYYAGVVDRGDHTDRASWEKLLELIDKL